ncbi:flagellar hook-length control protein FliK [Lachnospiraceae bacterium C1.1]|nr:flagellar hook-length control protein FliK [Lachnospiraceae bacterium C1.1]
MNITVNTSSGIYQAGNQNGNQISSERQVISQNLSSPTALVSSGSLSLLKSGDIFTGQISGMNEDGSVAILLANNKTLNARLSSNLTMHQGQIMSFQVKGSSSSTLTLTPLYENLDTNSAAAKALMAADLPVTVGNVDMVNAMMERGLPIDSNALTGMASAASAYPSANPASIVQMTQLGIPLTEENVQQFEAYKEGQYKIADGVDNLAKGFAQLGSESVSMNKAILDIFSEQPTAKMMQAVNEAMNGDSTKLLALIESESKDQTANIQGNNNEIIQTDSQLNSDPTNVSAEKNGEQPLESEIAASGNSKGAEAGTETQSDGKNIEGQLNTEASVEKNPVIKPDANLSLPGHVTNNLTQLLGTDGLKNMAELMNKAGYPPEITEKVSSGEISSEQLLKLIHTSMEGENASNFRNENSFNALKEMIGSEPYQLLLHNEIVKQYLLEPEAVADKEKVKAYYQKISAQAEEAIELLKVTGRGETTLAQGMQNLKDNIDFMNGMNMAMTYIQLPLKMNNAASHGDLYVYTNKKNLAKKDGNFSALLHLDMENLGTMDVHITMKNYDHVTTHFLLQKEEMLDFIEEHLSELDNALSKRGYVMHTDVSLNKEAKDVPEIMFNRGSNEKLIQKTAFDVRA